MEAMNNDSNALILPNSQTTFPFYRTEILKNLNFFDPNEMHLSISKNFDLLKAGIKAQMNSAKPQSKEEILAFMKSILSIKYHYYYYFLLKYS